MSRFSHQELKYVVISGTQPIIFPNTLTHADVARYTGGMVTSAGFCSKNPNGWDCWGRSESCNVNSTAEDHLLLDKVFGT